MEVRVQAPPTDDHAVPSHGGEQIENREAAVADKDETSRRQPVDFFVHNQ
jgi:hypothetical protein